ncbi:hypothetical protein HJC23_008471 [Cyclotella cryptica]|uniref:Uncharacterized protein n=1 Tax=Cyclotella cryptica TaxID=29204 RepID=A0ABD3QZX4_9STRA|eukprot:CCRYP_001193-RA/>CCRYP_001193-RA protein AED:0.00 eAED:0.00 QI:203/1/1/1/0/0.5/2/396/244
MVASNDMDLGIDSPTLSVHVSPSHPEPELVKVPTYKGLEIEHSTYSTPRRILSTTSTASLTSPLNKRTVFEADLIAYSTEQASKLSYPVGCPVWYIYNGDASPDSVLSKVRHGKVNAVAMNVATRSFVYKIEKTTGEEGEAPAVDLVLEDNIAYAVSCPVQVTIEDKEFDGEVICPSDLKDFTGNDKTYSVMLVNNGNMLRIEHGVSSRQIKYRGVNQLLEKEEAVTPQAVTMDASRRRPFACW